MKKILYDFKTVNYAVSMLVALQRIAKYDDAYLSGVTREAIAHMKKAAPIKRIGTVSISSGNELIDFLHMILFLDLIAYERLKRRLAHYSDDLFAVHECLGRLDAAIAIGSYRQSEPDFTAPELRFEGGQGEAVFEGVCHPLLKDAVRNDLAMTRPVLITGSNASGKSTWIKSVALCAIMAQSIGLCAARRYAGRAMRIYTSMALEDNLLGGESYYIVEIRSIQRILDASDGETPVFCAVDEVLRGTNTIERIAASAAICTELANRGILCMAATHDLELCRLLAPAYELKHFEEQIADGAMTFDYTLRPGAASSRNAIKLLALMGYPDEVIKEAERRAAAFTGSGQWT